MEGEILKLQEELGNIISNDDIRHSRTATQITLSFAVQKQIDILLKVDSTMCDKMITHGRELTVDKDTSTLLWQETAWHKTLKEEIENLRLLKTELEV